MHRLNRLVVVVVRFHKCNLSKFMHCASDYDTLCSCLLRCYCLLVSCLLYYSSGIAVNFVFFVIFTVTVYSARACVANLRMFISSAAELIVVEFYIGFYHCNF